MWALVSGKVQMDVRNATWCRAKGNDCACGSQQMHAIDIGLCCVSLEVLPHKTLDILAGYEL